MAMQILQAGDEWFLLLDEPTRRRLDIPPDTTLRLAVPATNIKPARASPQPMEGKVPPFTMKDHDGNPVTDKSLRGTPYVLYFYPKDDTPGCTREACGIRDAWADFEGAGLKVFGVSRDDSASHQKFIAKFDLPFPLLTADEDTLSKFGVWREKSMYGRTFMGIQRESVMVDADGTIVKHYRKVKPEQHAAELLADWKARA